MVLDTFTLLTKIDRAGDPEMIAKTKRLTAMWEDRDGENPLATYAGDQALELLCAPDDASADWVGAPAGATVGELAGWLYAFFTEQVTLEEAAKALDWMEGSGIDVAKAVLQSVAGNKPITKEKR